MPRDVKRSAYVNRILDNIRNVNKQRQEIDKILTDIRDARKDVNTRGSKLERSFAATDELVFKDAKAKPDYKEVYKILVELHEAFKKLDDTVTENGKALNDIDMIQAKISEMTARNDALDMKRYAQLRPDTVQLLCWSRPMVRLVRSLEDLCLCLLNHCVLQNCEGSQGNQSREPGLGRGVQN